MLKLEIVNISNLADISDYNYTVKINYRVITQGTVKGHTRSNGWIPLVQMILDKELGIPRCHVCNKEMLVDDVGGGLERHVCTNPYCGE